jgi:hypothetical protein
MITASSNPINTSRYTSRSSHDASALQQFCEVDDLEDCHCDDEHHLEDLIAHVDFGIGEDLVSDLLFHQEISLRNGQQCLYGERVYF